MPRRLRFQTSEQSVWGKCEREARECPLVLTAGACSLLVTSFGRKTLQAGREGVTSKVLANAAPDSSERAGIALPPLKYASWPPVSWRLLLLARHALDVELELLALQNVAVAPAALAGRDEMQASNLPVSNWL